MIAEADPSPFDSSARSETHKGRVVFRFRPQHVTDAFELSGRQLPTLSI
jgi:hypothetical protein